MSDVIRRKINNARPQQAEGTPGADRAWRLALARAARDQMGLDLDIRHLAVSRASLAEVLEIAPERSLVALLDGPEAGLGVLFMDPAITAALIEMQTMGQLSKQPPSARKPTRIDAAMVAGLIDRALIGLEDALMQDADVIWAGGFRYASHLEDTRPLALLLEDEAYRLLTADIAVGGFGREGQVVLVLPARGRGVLPVPLMAVGEAAAPPFTLALADQVLQAACFLDGVVARLRLPLGRIMALQPDEILPLPLASLDNISLETLDGQGVARARLGQNRGMRALKLAEAEGERKASQAGPPPPMVPVIGPEVDSAPALRAAG